MPGVEVLPGVLVGVGAAVDAGCGDGVLAVGATVGVGSTGGGSVADGAGEGLGSVADAGLTPTSSERTSAVAKDRVRMDIR